MGSPLSPISSSHLGELSAFSADLVFEQREGCSLTMSRFRVAYEPKKRSTSKITSDSTVLRSEPNVLGSIIRITVKRL